jgi:hypothetical protein
MDRRPFWISIAIVTCVVTGSAMNRCLTCAQPLRAAAPPVAPVAGDPFLEEAPRDIEPKPKPAPVAETPKPAGLEDHEDLTFDKLASYQYQVEDLKDGQVPKDQIPASVRALQGRKIAIKGFMIPYRNDGENVTEFILLRNQGLCCFGIVPRMNEWIHVRMAPGCHAPYATDVPLTVFGALDVGEAYEKGGIGPGGYRKGLGPLMSLYRMESTRVIAPPVFR